jgi:putative iron-dependent peroxidase
VPSATLLEALADRSPSANANEASAPESLSSAESVSGGSLNIGSLKGAPQYE